MQNLEKEFFRFIYNRHLIWYKRFILKQTPPWTEDEILKTYKIINVYRELDKCTVYLLEKLKDVKDREQLLVNVIFYRFFNRINLYEELEIDLFDKTDKSKIIINLNKIRFSGKPIFNNAYLISSGGKNQEKHITILNNLENLNTKELVDLIDKSTTPEVSFETLKKIPMVGSFLACEIWTDLTYFNFFKQNWNDNDFVNIGPGAKWGLEILYNKKLDKKEQSMKLKHLYKIQEKILSDLNFKPSWREIAYKNSFSNYPFLSITNIEGSLCEFRKYWNIKNGKGKRKYFKPGNYLNNLQQNI